MGAVTNPGIGNAPVASTWNKSKGVGSTASVTGTPIRAAVGRGQVAAVPVDAFSAWSDGADAFAPTARPVLAAGIHLKDAAANVQFS